MPEKHAKIYENQLSHFELSSYHQNLSYDISIHIFIFISVSCSIIFGYSILNILHILEAYDNIFYFFEC